VPIVARDHLIRLVSQAKPTTTWSKANVESTRQGNVRGASQTATTFRNNANKVVADRLYSIAITRNGAIAEAGCNLKKKQPGELVSVVLGLAHQPNLLSHCGKRTNLLPEHNMGRLLSIFLLLFVALSHGAIGDGAPHVHAIEYGIADYDHYDSQVDFAAVDHDDAAPDGENGADKSGLMLGHHAHVPATAVPNAEVALARFDYEKMLQPLRDDAALDSMGLAPPTEPPSA
jgi:hypothetical protein